MQKQSIFFLILTLLISACVKPLSKGGASVFFGTGTGTGSGTGTGTGSGTTDFPLGLFVRGEGLGLERTEIRSVTGGTVQLAPGRVHGLVVENGDQVRQPLVCNTGTQANVLYVNVPAFTSGGAITFSCTSGAQSFTLNVGYAGGSKLALVAEKVAAVSQSAGTDSSPPAVSGDGRYVFYSVASPSHTGSLGKQILRLDTQTGLKRLVSCNALGTPGNGHSTRPSVSTDGRYVAFLSTSTNLFFGPTGTQVYRKDLQTEAIALISTPNGTDGATGPVLNPQISGDGKRVVFHGSPSNFGFTLTSQQVFLRDTVANTTTLVSTVNGGSNPGVGDSYDPTISADGTKVSFSSTADLTGQGLSVFTHTFLKQLYPAAQPTIMVSAVSGVEANGNSYNQGISADGQYVFIRTNAGIYTGSTNLIYQIGRRTLPGNLYTLVSTESGAAGDSDDQFGGNSADGNKVGLIIQSSNLLTGWGAYKIARRDISAGTLTLVKGLNQFDTGAAPQQYATLSSDGTAIAFSTPAYDAMTSALGRQVYYKKFPSGSVQLASTGDGNAFGIASSAPLISGNGNFVVFISSDARFSPNGRGQQAYRKNLTTGETQIVSAVVASGITYPANAPVTDVAISSTGRFVAFSTAATNFAPNGSVGQVYRKDMSTGVLTIVSRNNAGTSGDAASSSPSVSADGQKVAFTSSASNLVSGGGPIVGGSQRIFLRNYDTPATTLISTTASGTSANGNCSEPSLSDAGDRVAFTCSGATNLLSTPTVTKQVFAKALDATGTVTLLSSENGTAPGQGDSYAPKIDGPGTTYTFVSRATNFEGGTSPAAQIYRKVIGSAPQLASRAAGGLPADVDCTAPSLSTGGDFILFGSGATNLVSGVSGDHVYRKNFATGALTLISTTATAAANTASASGNLSALGDKIVFSSSATNLVGGVSGSQLYLAVP